MKDLIAQSHAAQQNFQERMINRIREDIGQLMTDEELSKLVERAMEEIFFKPEVEKRGFHETTKPPWLHNFVKELLEKKVEAAVGKYVDEHEDEVRQALKEVMQEGVGTAVLRAIASKFSSDMVVFEQSILQRLQQGY